MPPPRKPAIALLSDHTLFRQALSQLLTQYGLGPISEVETKAELSALQRPIDIAIIDLDHEKEDTLTLVHTLRREMPELHLLVLGTPIRQAAVEYSGLETPEVDRDALVTALVQGFRAAADKPPHRNWSRITARQRDVMRWLATGLDNAAIGEKLRIGERAVKAHISSLLALFSLANRTQLALLADRAGLRPPAKR
jgi:two-component system, NarL family, nitrate/nitrite response regulator NarL